MNYLLRRRKLGATSCSEISRMSATGIRVVRNDNIPAGKAGVVFRWGCTSTVDADVIVNNAASIHRVSNKKDFRLLLDEHELCPTTWGSLVAFHQDTSPRTWPMIVRPAQHAQGKNVLLCNNEQELEAACARFPSYYIAEYIKKEAEYRVCVVQGRVAWVANKIPDEPNAIAWNVARGGSFENVRWDQWPLKACRIAVEAFNLSGLDFGGVDIMMKDGEAYVLEINSAPSLTSPYRQQCMAKCFDWIVTNGKSPLPVDSTRRGDWKKWAHPSLDERVWR